MSSTLLPESEYVVELAGFWVRCRTPEGVIALTDAVHACHHRDVAALLEPKTTSAPPEPQPPENLTRREGSPVGRPAPSTEVVTTADPLDDRERRMLVVLRKLMPNPGDVIRVPDHFEGGDRKVARRVAEQIHQYEYNATKAPGASFIRRVDGPPHYSQAEIDAATGILLQHLPVVGNRLTIRGLEDQTPREKAVLRKVAEIDDRFKYRSGSDYVECVE